MALNRHYMINDNLHNGNGGNKLEKWVFIALKAGGSHRRQKGRHFYARMLKTFKIMQTLRLREFAIQMSYVSL